MIWLSPLAYTQDTSNNNVSWGATMLTPDQMTLALRAVTQIDEQSLLAVTSKLIDDLRKGVYPDGHQLSTRVRVGDLAHVPDWWNETYYVALIVACASGNLVRLACRAVGVNPCLGSFQQMVTLVTALNHIEREVACKLLFGGNPMSFSA